MTLLLLPTAAFSLKKLLFKILLIALKQSVYFRNLDSLRFLAFLLVFLQHGFYNGFKLFIGESDFTNSLINFFFASGGTGVQIFFVLSGFLITYLLLVELRSTGTVNILQFYTRRVLRIWPLYFAVLIFSFVIYPGLKGLIDIDSGLCSRPWYYFTFLANFDSIYISNNCPGRDAMTQGIVWSVSIEEQFYLFWPLLMFIFRKKWTNPMFISVIFASLLFRYLNVDDDAALYFHTFSVMGDLALGSIGAYLMISNPKFSGLIRDLPRPVILLCYLLILLGYYVPDQVFHYTGSAVFSRIILNSFWLFIILEQCFCANSPFQLGNISSFNSLGKISYGLYMLHPIGILIVDVSLRVLKIPQTSFLILFLSGVAGLSLSILLARLSYRWLEQPFLNLKERFSIIHSRTLPND